MAKTNQEETVSKNAVKKITIDDALKNQFRFSTDHELDAYAKELGDVTFHEKEDWDAKRAKLMARFGQKMDNNFSSVGFKPGTIVNKNKGRIVPEYGLSPEDGDYGGRRIRCVIQKPHGVQRESVRLPSVNGYQVPIKYGQPVCIPEPIFLALRSAMDPVVRQQKIMDGNVTDRTTTFLEYRPTNIISEAQVDPETAHLCASLVEWYQRKGPEFIAGLSESDLNIVAKKLQLQLDKKEGNAVRRLTVDEIRDAVFIFVFGDIPYFGPDGAEEAA